MAERQRKKAYVKMRIEKVHLVPQEAVLGICKTSTGGGLGNTGDCVLSEPQCQTSYTS